MSDKTAWADRVGALCGTAYVVLILVGNQISTGGGQAAHPSGEDDLADFARMHDSLSAVAGMTMEVVGFVAFVFFVAWLVQRLRDQGGAAAWLAGAAGIAGTTTLAVKIASFMPIAAGVTNRRTLDAATAQVLTDMNSAAFVITFLTFGVFLLACGLAILVSGWLGRIAGWSSTVLGALGIVATLVSATDPVNANPVPFLLGLLWILVISIKLALRGPARSGRTVPESAAAVRA